MCLRFFFPAFANRPANSLTLAIDLPARMVVFVFEKLYRNRTGIDKNKQDQTGINKIWQEFTGINQNCCIKVKNQGKAHIIVKFFVWTFFWKKRKISGQKKVIFLGFWPTFIYCWKSPTIWCFFNDTQFCSCTCKFFMISRWLQLWR